MKTLSHSAQLDNLFGALGNAKRRSILHTLAFRPATVTQLAEEHELSLPAIHKHIRALEEAQLIQRKKVGRINFVALNKTALAVVQRWVNQYHTEWGNDRETLDNYIAGFKQ